MSRMSRRSYQKPPTHQRIWNTTKRHMEPWYHPHQSYYRTQSLETSQPEWLLFCRLLPCQPTWLFPCYPSFYIKWAWSYSRTHFLLGSSTSYWVTWITPTHSSVSLIHSFGSTTATTTTSACTKSTILCISSLWATSMHQNCPFSFHCTWRYPSVCYPLLDSLLLIIIYPSQRMSSHSRKGGYEDVTPVYCY